MARPRKEIDKEQFEKLCGLQCSKNEICGWFDVTDKTLDRWCAETYKSSFSDVFAKKRSHGLISLRRSQFKLAEKSATMAIFLGKNYLGQNESVTISAPESQSTIEAIAKLMFEKQPD